MENARLGPRSRSLGRIFGLLLSTLLTLGVVPTLYIIYSRFRIWLFRILNWSLDKEMDIMGLAEELKVLERKEAAAQGE